MPKPKLYPVLHVKCIDTISYFTPEIAGGNLFPRFTWVIYMRYVSFDMNKYKYMLYYNSVVCRCRYNINLLGFLRFFVLGRIEIL